MTPREAIEIAVPIFAKYTEIGLGEMRELLRHEGGLDHDQIDKILEFVPLAFGRGFLGDSGIAFADEYVRIDDEGVERERKKLILEPYYLEASMYAPLVMMRNGQEVFSAVALRSAEVRAINEALHAGSDLQDLQSAAPVLRWHGGRAAAPAQPSAKPWWKFW